MIFFELKTVNGEHYNPTSLRCVRAGLFIYFKTLWEDINIIDGNIFILLTMIS